MDIDTVGSVALLGGDEEGGVVLTLGNGCRTGGPLLPFSILEELVGLEGLSALALLSLRFLYSATLSWNAGLTGEKSPVFMGLA